MPRPLPLIAPPLIPTTLTHHTITSQQWSTTHPRLPHICVGALIFRLSPLTQKPQILLIKRASSDVFPNAWEIPGGGVESTDATLLYAVVREVWEETGLLVKEFKGQVWDRRAGERTIVKMEAEDGKGVEVGVVVGAKPGEGEVEFLGGRRERWCKLNFLVDVGEVKEGDVVLDDEEHQDWGWFGREDIVGEEGKGWDFISEQAVRIVERGFEEFEKGGLTGLGS
ncbi:hypothetical protein IFR05_004321 [Cadophora sp. M221]|nr:hypothetical protein IFR05_004321 [Cadophora sp. M221]